MSRKVLYALMILISAANYSFWKSGYLSMLPNNLSHGVTNFYPWEGKVLTLPFVFMREWDWLFVGIIVPLLYYLLRQRCATEKINTQFFFGVIFGVVMGGYYSLLQVYFRGIIFSGMIVGLIVPYLIFYMDGELKKVSTEKCFALTCFYAAGFSGGVALVSSALIGIIVLLVMSIFFFFLSLPWLLIKKRRRILA